MPAVTDRPEAASPESGDAWDKRPIAGRWPGLPWWEAALIALGATVFATMIDVAANDQPTTLSEMVYWLGCVVAICVVRRRNVFTPMVQPPLVLAIGLPLGLLPSKGLPNSFGFRDLALTFGIPIINSFPVMALTTVFTVIIGAFRLIRERDPDRHGLPARGSAGGRGPAGASASGGRSAGARSARAGSAGGRPPGGRRSAQASSARGTASPETVREQRKRPATVDGQRPTPSARRRRPADTDVFDAPARRAAPSPSARRRPVRGAEEPPAPSVRRRPVGDEPAARRPVGDEPAARRPVSDEPAARRPVSDEPAARRPAPRRPVADEPVRGDLLGGRSTADDAPRRGRIERPWESERANPQVIPSADSIEPPPIRRRVRRSVDSIEDLTGEPRRRYRDD